VRRAFGVDGEAELVDRHVMVVPTQGDKVVGVVVATRVLFCDVVRLQAMTAAASFDGALSPVPFEHECSNRRGDRLGSMRNCEGAVAVAVDDSSATVAEDLGQGVGSDTEAAAGGGAGFSVSRCGHSCVYKDFGYNNRPTGLLTFGSTGQAVEAYICEGVRQLLAMGLIGDVGKGRGSLAERLIDDLAIDAMNLAPQLVHRGVEVGLNHQVPILERSLLLER
jgi:hypothetical protein